MYDIAAAVLNFLHATIQKLHNKVLIIPQFYMEYVFINACKLFYNLRLQFTELFLIGILKFSFCNIKLCLCRRSSFLIALFSSFFSAALHCLRSGSINFSLCRRLHLTDFFFRLCNKLFRTGSLVYWLRWNGCFCFYQRRRIFLSVRVRQNTTQFFCIQTTLKSRRSWYFPALLYWYSFLLSIPPQAFFQKHIAVNHPLFFLLELHPVSLQ